MQAEEVQKELEELKAKNAVAEQTSQSDAVALRERLESAEKERDDVTFRLGSAEVERNEALRKVKDMEERSRELHERLVSLTEVSNMVFIDALLHENLATVGRPLYCINSSLIAHDSSIYVSGLQFDSS